MRNSCDICKGTGEPFKLKVGAVPATMGGRDFLPEGLGYGIAYAICYSCENDGWIIPKNVYGNQMVFKNKNIDHSPLIVVVDYSDERRV